MSNQLVDIYLADINLWSGLSWGGTPGYAEQPPHPARRPGVDLMVPTISMGASWSGIGGTIRNIVGDLEAGQQIDRFFMAGHGSSGEFTVGSTLAWDNDSAIAEFRRFRPFAPTWRTNVYIIGCEVAADGPCVNKTVNWLCGAGPMPQAVCAGEFSGHTEKHGYQLLRKIADAINCPVHGTVWKLPLSIPWPDQFKYAPRLTVGPGGGWVYRGGACVAETIRYGGPRGPDPKPVA